MRDAMLYIAAAILSQSNAVARSLSGFGLTSRQYDDRVGAIDANAPEHASEFFKFKSRPDIDAPKWNVEIYQKDSLASGYWFVATYENVLQKESENKAWVGPYIYDQAGGLVWSGTSLFRGYNVKDFKVSKLGGVDMLTGIFVQGEYEIILDSTYEFYKKLPVEYGSFVNIHDFGVFEEGKRAVAMTIQRAYASFEESAAIGFPGQCIAAFPGFEERDTSTWQLIFAWNAQGHIRLQESYVESECRDEYDFLHANSVDKFFDGDYLLSCRHTDALYKISAKTGKIVWRLGGKFNDFVFADGLHFSGQHDARVLEQNDTHTIISLLDNAIRPGTPHITNELSRGIIISLSTATLPMTARPLRFYDHPEAGYAPGRGNFQSLGDGNVFLGWWNRSLISEYSPNGSLLMKANWKADLNSYRSYKFDWKGFPTQPPDVYAESILLPDEGPKTHIYVSWNGATEVDSWTFFKAASANGHDIVEIGRSKRWGFETLMEYNGAASNVLVEGVDKQGRVLGVSVVVRTATSQSSMAQDSGFQAQHYGLDIHVTLPEARVAELYMLCAICILVVSVACKILWREGTARRMRSRLRKL